MPKSIVTKFFGPTNFKGSRIRAQAEGGKRPHTIYVGYDHDGTRDDSHRSAAIALCKKMNWKCGPNGSYLIEGGLPNGDHVWSFLPAEIIKTLEYAVVAGERIQKGKRDGGTMGMVSIATDAARELLTNGKVSDETHVGIIWGLAEAEE